MNNVWFTSDHHFGHNNIITFCNRPFTDTEDMQERLIANHNELVKPGDRVYILGDMFWRTTRIQDAMSIALRMNGQKFYINGNHEELFKNKSLRDLFIWCKDIENLKVEGYPNVFLCHYAMRTWNGSHKGAYQLYGHTHGTLPEDSSLSCDVGVDAWGFKPVSLEQIHEKMQNKIKERDNETKP